MTISSEYAIPKYIVPKNIVLDVGDTIYPTTTLILRKSSYLKSVIESQGGEDPLFVDRDGPLFREVLYFLRTGELFDVDDEPNLKRLKVEAAFFGITSLVSKIDNVLNSKINVAPQDA